MTGKPTLAKVEALTDEVADLIVDYGLTLQETDGRAACRAVVILHYADIGGKSQGVRVTTMGRPVSTLETVGILELAKLEVMEPTDG